MKKVLLYLWQLPQNLAGLAVIKVTKATDAYFYIDAYDRVVKAYVTKNIRTSVALGEYIILQAPHQTSATDIQHEYGHTRQSLYLGWLYLPIIGIFSGLHNVLCKCRKHSYFKVWTERWADKLGKVRR